MSTPRYLSMDGALVPYAQATVHVLAPAMTYGATVFEGIRGYWSERQQDCLLFRLEDHLRRLAFSMKVMRFERGLDRALATRWIRELIIANELRDEIHVRILAYVSEGPNMYTTAPVSISIAALSRPGRKPGQAGVRGVVSSWRRISDDAMPPRVKCAANYQNGRLASLQARADGYDLPILLAASGHVAEAPGSCIFMVRDGRLITPAVNSDILESITRETVIALAGGTGDLIVEERDIDRSELYDADELFACGSASEIVPIVQIDGYEVGNGTIGPVVERLSRLYAGAVRGEGGSAGWLTPVYGDAPRPTGDLFQGVD